MHDAAIVNFPQRPEDRLRLALRALDAALAEQGDAVADLRRELAKLTGAVHGVQHGLGAYDIALAMTAQEASRATLAARRLEGTAAAFAS